MKNLAQQFLLLSKGEASAEPNVVRALYELLAKGDALKILQLSVELTRLGDDGVLRMFDVIMNTATTGVLSGAKRPEDLWHAYALCSCFTRPAGLALERLDNPAELERLISEVAGIPPSDVHVISTRLPAQTAFYMSPSDVFSFTHALRVAMAGRSDAHWTPDARRAIAQAVAPLLSPSESNAWLAPTNAVVNDESIFMVMLRPGHHSSQVFSKKVAALTQSFFNFEAKYILEDAPLQPVGAAHEAISFGAPWSLFRAALHIAQSKPLVSIVLDLAVAHRLTNSDISVSIARVDDDTGGEYSTRVGVHHRLKGLMLGLSIPNLVEHDQFALLTQRIFRDSGLGPVTHSATAYVASEVDEGGKARVLVPGRGWQIAPAMLIRQPPVVLK